MNQVNDPHASEPPADGDGADSAGVPPGPAERLREAVADGAVTGDTVSVLCAELGVDLHHLAVLLLPYAARRAVAPVSDFSVGAIAYAESEGGRACALYLGANVEFPAQSLGCSVHAEQSAVHNAWQAGAPPVTHLAVSAPPCGHCRQFLLELVTAEQLTIITGGSEGPAPAAVRLADLLPHPFGPSDLGFSGRFMSSDAAPTVLGLGEASSDPLVHLALAEACSSYAPYGRGPAGAAIETADGGRFTGRYAESAAHNPSLPPLSAALSYLAIRRPLAGAEIRRAVLVEVPSSVSQRAIAEAVLRSVAPTVSLEYHRALRASVPTAAPSPET